MRYRVDFSSTSLAHLRDMSASTRARKRLPQVQSARLQIEIIAGDDLLRLA